MSKRPWRRDLVLWLAPTSTGLFVELLLDIRGLMYGPVGEVRSYRSLLDFPSFFALVHFHPGVCCSSVYMPSVQPINWLTRKGQSDIRLCKRNCPVYLDASSLRAPSGSVSKDQRSRENVECPFPKSCQPAACVEPVYIAVLGESRYQKGPLVIYLNITSLICRNGKVQVATIT